MAKGGNGSVPIILGLGGIAAVLITAGISGKGIGKIVSGQASIGSEASSYLQSGQAQQSASEVAATVDSGSSNPIATATQIGASGTSPANIIEMVAWCNNVAGQYDYTWGGGHQLLGQPNSGACSSDGSGSCFGFDCSGAVSGALGSAGLLNAPETSGELMDFGLPGKGKYVTIWANETHTFMQIEGHWFGTGYLGRDGGANWGNFDPDLAAYAVRHPQGY